MITYQLEFNINGRKVKSTHDLCSSYNIINLVVCKVCYDPPKKRMFEHRMKFMTFYMVKHLMIGRLFSSNMNMTIVIVIICTSVIFHDPLYQKLFSGL